MEPGEAKSKVRARFERTVADTDDFHGASLLIHSGSRDVHWNLAAGRAGRDPVQPEQPFYPASVGKTFTATIVAMLVEEGELGFDDPIPPYPSDEVLNGLHVHRGTDYTDDVRVHHLLTHTSGLPHLLGDEYGLFSRRNEESPEGKTFFDVMVEDPDRFWAPRKRSSGPKRTSTPTSRPGTGSSTPTSATTSSD